LGQRGALRRLKAETIKERPFLGLAPESFLIFFWGKRGLLKKKGVISDFWLGRRFKRGF